MSDLFMAYYIQWIRDDDDDATTRCRQRVSIRCAEIVRTFYVFERGRLLSVWGEVCVVRSMRQHLSSNSMTARRDDAGLAHLPCVFICSVARMVSFACVCTRSFTTPSK